MAARPIEGRVKSVLSGDTVVLQSPSNPKAEKVISLAYVTSPRLRKDGTDEVSVQARSRHPVGSQLVFI